MKTTVIQLTFLCCLLMGQKEARAQQFSSTDCESDEFDCPVINPPDNNLGTIGAVSGTDISFPCFNPNNSSEFVFVRKLPDSPASTLCIHDLVTGISTCLPIEHGMNHQPRWHSNGWILFRGNWSDVYRIMSSGGGIDTVSIPSETISYKRPIWRPNGQGWIANTSLEFDGDIEVYGLDGNVEELIPGVEFNLGDWSEDNRIVTKYGNGSGLSAIVWSHAEILDWQTIPPDPNGGTFQDIKWIPGSNEVMYSQMGNDIMKVNTLTLERTMVKDGCPDRYYEVFSISHDGSKIVAERFMATGYTTEGAWNYKHIQKQIVIMNCDGTEETVIDLAGSIDMAEWQANEEVMVFPNPSAGLFNIQTPTHLQNAFVAVHDLTGRQVYRARLSGANHTIDLSSVPTGLYILSIGEGPDVKRIKILKE